MAKVSKRLRFEILRRDNHQCRYCGAGAPDVKLVVDHVMPEALGGSSEPANLVAACEPCNSGKTSTMPGAPLVENVTQDAMRWAEAMEFAARCKEAELTERLERNAGFLNEWKDYPAVPLPDDWEAAIDRLRVAGMTDRLFREAIAVAMGARNVALDNRFRYFCGVSWRMVTDLQEIARDTLGQDLAERSPAFVEALAGDGMLWSPLKEDVRRAVDEAVRQCRITVSPWQRDEMVVQLTDALKDRA